VAVTLERRMRCRLRSIRRIETAGIKRTMLGRPI
jgi:hypothetical protein